MLPIHILHPSAIPAGFMRLDNNATDLELKNHFNVTKEKNIPYRCLVKPEQATVFQ